MLKGLINHDIQVSKWKSPLQNNQLWIPKKVDKSPCLQTKNTIHPYYFGSRILFRTFANINTDMYDIESK